MDSESRPTPCPYWRVWKAASALDYGGTSSLLQAYDENGTILNNNESQNIKLEDMHLCQPVKISRIESPYGPLASEAADILREWGHRWAGRDGFQSLLNKRSLLHEIEESLVAIHSLLEWLTPLQKEQNKSDNEERLTVTVVDLCCGKGIFSMLLSFMAARSCDLCKPLQIIERSVMVEKATTKDINWNHIKKTNEDVETASTKSSAQIPIEIWDGTNIHDDDMFEKLQTQSGIVGIVGIHLCKTLGPRCVSLFNSLGPKKATFLCLAPCCLPRFKNKIIVNLYETNSQRTMRLKAKKLYEEKSGKGKEKKCFICQSDEHRVRDCPSIPMEAERKKLFVKIAPCWKCGIVGHMKADCPSATIRQKPLVCGPPTVNIDMVSVANSNDPFKLYCQLLAQSIQCPKAEQNEMKIIETNLSGNQTHSQEKNWNQKRKTKYIVVERIRK